MTKPIIAANVPVPVELEAGKTYFFCSCGRSAGQPFCDGSHRGTGMAPLSFTADKDGTRYFCQCKTTGNPPFCDGSHKTIGADQVGEETP